MHAASQHLRRGGAAGHVAVGPVWRGRRWPWAVIAAGDAVPAAERTGESPAGGAGAEPRAQMAEGSGSGEVSEMQAAPAQAAARPPRPLPLAGSASADNRGAAAVACICRYWTWPSRREPWGSRRTPCGSMTACSPATSGATSEQGHVPVRAGPALDARAGGRVADARSGWGGRCRRLALDLFGCADESAFEASQAEQLAHSSPEELRHWTALNAAVHLDVEVCVCCSALHTLGRCVCVAAGGCGGGHGGTGALPPGLTAKR